MGKTVSEIIIERFLKDVDEKGTMPWQRPYEMYNAFNYYTMKAYRGINRFLLPSGEYITANQMRKYNMEKGYIKEVNGKLEVSPQAYKMTKGIEWYPVVFFTVNSKEVGKEYVQKVFPKEDLSSVEGLIGVDEFGYSYYKREDKFFKEKNILRYYNVANIKYFKNADGECPPSRIELGEVEITKQNPKKVLDDYIKREGIHLQDDYGGIPCYIPATDTIKLNPYYKSEDAWFSTAFHECSHSTGAFHRLKRKGIVNFNRKGSDEYAKEECIAELSACLCCAETGVSNFKTSNSAEYDNQIAYVQSWKEYIKNWGNSFIYICSQADKAFNYICNNPDSNM